MAKKLLKWILLFTFIVALVLATFTPALADGAQVWYLDREAHPDVAGKYVMEKAPAGLNQQSGKVTFVSGASKIWLADEVAISDVTFPNGKWVIRLETDGYWGGVFSPKCVIVMGEWETADSNFRPFYTTTIDKLTWSGGTQLLRGELLKIAETVHTGNYLALKITNEDSVEHFVVTDGSSFVESPASNPGYPTPEVSTFILLGIGLITLVGYLFIRQRTHAGAKA